MVGKLYLNKSILYIYKKEKRVVTPPHTYCITQRALFWNPESEQVTPAKWKWWNGLPKYFLTPRETCSLHELLGHSQMRQRAWVGPEFLFLQGKNHRQQCPVRLTGSASQCPIGASEPWKKGLCFSPVSQYGEERREELLPSGVWRKGAGLDLYVCVCVCVCTPTHWCTDKPLHRKRLVCMYNIKYKVSSSESYHNYITHFWLQGNDKKAVHSNPIRGWLPILSRKWKSF